MAGQHNYTVLVQWTGNNGFGTTGYTTYERSHTISVDNKPTLLASSDPAFRGDKNKYNPEELLVASLSSCHMLWYLHLCAEAGVVVLEYEDNATGTLMEDKANGGRFSEVVLHPIVTVEESFMIPKAIALHENANRLCFIANSVNFLVSHQPICITKQQFA
jgi:organic hydroperoxide reductase OsmC/OhrA